MAFFFKNNMLIQIVQQYLFGNFSRPVAFWWTAGTFTSFPPSATHFKLGSALERQIYMESEGSDDAKSFGSEPDFSYVMSPPSPV